MNEFKFDLKVVWNGVVFVLCHWFTQMTTEHCHPINGWNIKKKYYSNVIIDQLAISHSIRYHMYALMMGKKFVFQLKISDKYNFRWSGSHKNTRHQKCRSLTFELDIGLPVSWTLFIFCSNDYENDLCERRNLFLKSIPNRQAYRLQSKRSSFIFCTPWEIQILVHHSLNYQLTSSNWILLHVYKYFYVVFSIYFSEI